MYIKGAVSSVVYYNAENGYAVITVETEDREYTCVGNMPIVSVGEVLEITGNLTVHSKYGEQIAVQSFIVSAPKGKEGIIRYLSSGLIRGVGEATAKKIYSAFKEKTLEVMEAEPTKLAEIKGISMAKALEIANSYMEIRKMQTQIMFLQEYNISNNTAIKIYNVYKDATKQVVKDNPYKLIDDVDGVGFITADKIARNMGHAEDSPFRIRAAVIYCLKEGADKNGNTYLPIDQLIDMASKVLRLDLSEYEGTVKDIFDRLELDVMVKRFKLDDVDCVALTRYYNLEKSIASQLVKLKKDATPLTLDFKTLIAEFERINSISFHVNQVEAVTAAVTNGVTVITGGPGTGKTTIVKCIAHIFGTQGLKIEFCTPTGRAAKRLSQATGAEAKTIHRMLGMNYTAGQVNFLYNQYNTLNADVIVVDELSMVDVTIMSSLLKAIRNGSRLIMVGDKDQLPSVGAGNVLADIINSGIIDVKYLTYIYRQSEDSLIISNAHLINECKMPVIKNSSKDFFYINAEGDEMLTTVRDLVSTRLPKFAQVSSNEIQVLAPLKNGKAGVDNCNLTLQKALNPPQPSKKEIKVGDTVFRVGDRVMQTANDYQLQWTKFGQFGAIESGEGVFNGDIGFIVNIDSATGYVEVEYDDKRVAQYTQVDLYNLMLAYAVTIHKSQGCEFEVVVIPISSGPPSLLNKNLLYTAVTRAKKVVVLVGTKKVLAMTVHNNYILQRTTMLDKFIVDENEKYEKFFA